MDIKEILKGLGIDEDMSSKIETGINSELHKSFIPKEQYNKKVETLKGLENKVKEFEDAQVKQKDNNANSDILNNILEKLNKYETERENQAKEQRINGIKTKLEEKGMNSKISSLVLKDIDLNSSDDDIVTDISSNYSEYFSTTKIEGVEVGSKGASASGQSGYTVDQINQMPEEQLSKLMNENPNFMETIIYE